MHDVLAPFVHLVSDSAGVWIGLVFVFSLLVGSFLNVVIHRLPRMMEREWHAQAAELRGEPLPEAPRFNLATPRSRCPHCGHVITALENIPVVSYLVLRGRCRHCSAPIGRRYPVVELLTAALSGYAAWHFGFGLAAAGALLFIWAVVALTFIDLDTQLLPDDLTLPLRNELRARWNQPVLWPLVMLVMIFFVLLFLLFLAYRKKQRRSVSKVEL